MAQIEKIVDYIKRWEGGYANDPLDRGGATMAGVTMGTYKHYCRRIGKPTPTVQDLKNITHDEWLAVMKTLYWDRWRADEIVSQKVANILVDWVWGSGIWGIKIPQRVLGVKQDGIVGPITLNAVNAQDPDEFFERIFMERKKFLYKITQRRPANRKFIKGWLNRLNDIKNI